MNAIMGYGPLDLLECGSVGFPRALPWAFELHAFGVQASARIAILANIRGPEGVKPESPACTRVPYALREQ